MIEFNPAPLPARARKPHSKFGVNAQYVIRRGRTNPGSPQGSPGTTPGVGGIVGQGVMYGNCPTKAFMPISHPPSRGQSSFLPTNPMAAKGRPPKITKPAQKRFLLNFKKDEAPKPDPEIIDVSQVRLQLGAIHKQMDLWERRNEVKDANGVITKVEDTWLSPFMSNISLI